LKPLGNRSVIEETAKDGKVILKDLYGSDKLGFGSWLWGFGSTNVSTFDDGMVAFLACLEEVCKRVQGNSLSIPYAINGDKIGNQSIRMQSTTEELWTKALKHVLINLNFLLAWTSTGRKK
jgi:beclin 1